MGRSKGVRGKICTPVLVLIHAFFSALPAFLLADSSDYSLMGELIRGSITFMHFAIGPPIVIMQIVAQYRELRKRDDLGALSLRSFALQAAVMFVLAVRLIVKLGWRPSFDQSKDPVPAEEGHKISVGETIVNYAVGMWVMDLVSWTYLCWVGGAVFVWHKTVYRRDLKGRHVELEGLLGDEWE
jgi:hypothetical protein